MSDRSLIIQPKKSGATFEQPRLRDVVLGGHPLKYIEQPGMVLPVTRPNPLNPSQQTLDPGVIVQRLSEDQCMIHALMREVEALREAIIQICEGEASVTNLAEELVQRCRPPAQDADPPSP